MVLLLQLLETLWGFWLLNNVTENDRYPIPHIQDFSAHLARTSIFSKINLVRGYHQETVRAEDVPKTAIITPFGLFELPGCLSFLST